MNQKRNIRKSLIQKLKAGNEKSFLVFFPDMGGNLLYARPFIEGIGDQTTVCGLKVDPNLIKEPSTLTLEDLAKRYADELILFKPDTQLNLIGHSFGALLAYETARQLEKKGHVPLNLFLIDVSVPLRYQKIKLSDRPLWFLHLLADSMRWLKGQTLGLIKPGCHKFFRNSNLPGTSWTILRNYVWIDPSQHPAAYREILITLFSAMYHYKPDDFNGPLCLFRATGLVKNSIREFSPRDLGWQELCSKKITVFDIEGNHLDMVRNEACVQSICRMLDERMGL
jgi:thioesterase domain-containing protein